MSIDENWIKIRWVVWKIYLKVQKREATLYNTTSVYVLLIWK